LMAVPYMPLYVADYMADAAHLTTVEHGAYLLLLMTYWQRGGPLPDNDKKLARIAGLGMREWARIRPTILEFFEIARSEWVHKRVETELSNLRAKSLKKRNGGLARAKQMHSTCTVPAKLIVDTDTDTVPLDKSNGAAPASDRDFWANAKSYIGGNNPGALIGKWRRDFGQDETAKAITAAQLERAVDPVSYVTKILRNHGAEAERPLC
jgi:uncharacterized protein YdaU (DUF1376 family)